MSVVTLVEFLTARLDEDQAVARVALSTSGVWDAYEINDEPQRQSMTGVQLVERQDAGDVSLGVVLATRDRFPGMLTNSGDVLAPGQTGIEWFAHIARHDPARVLREVEAKRAIVALTLNLTDGDPDEFSTLRHLAAVYSDHPDYDEAWRG